MNIKEDIGRVIGECQDTMTFKLLDPNHSLLWYVGFDENGHKSAALIAPGKMVTTDSTSNIEVTLSERKEDGTVVLKFSLLSPKYDDIFTNFVSDIVESTRNTPKVSAINIAIRRWNNWRSVFKKEKIDYMSKEKIKGLLGEMIFLHDFVATKYGIDNAIESWQGPDNSHKDFEIEKTFYEVKSVSSGALTVGISSAEQLDGPFEGELDVIYLDDVNETVDDKYTLNIMYKKINSLIDDEDTKIKFLNKVNEAGYLPDEYYDSVAFKLVAKERYLVDDEFPKITSNDLKDGIAKISYQILFDKIATKKIVEE